MKNIFKFLTGLVVAASLYAAPSTRTFTANTTGTNPNTVTYTNNIISVDLTGLNGQQVYKADFYPGRSILNGQNGSTWNTTPWTLIVGDNDTLRLAPPRFSTFDVTKLIRDSISTGRASFRVISAPGLNSADLQMAFRITTSLDYGTTIQQPSIFSGRFKDGEIIFTFSEVNPPAIPATPTYLDIANARVLMDASSVISYKIYKTKVGGSVDSAVKYSEFIDEIRPLSCWNDGLLSIGGDNSQVISPLPIDDLTPASPGTGIYVHKHTSQVADTSFYFVSRSVDGVENFSNVVLTGPMISTPGNGLAILRESTYPASFNNENNANVRRYVKWESYPNSPFPSTPHNYLVAIPQNYSIISPSPVTLALHHWSGSMEYPSLWWFNANQRAILVSSMQVPYDWWTAFNSNINTLKPLDQGTVQPYTQSRLLSFVFDNVTSMFNVDLKQIMLTGNSMGGSGSSQFGLRSGHIFSEVNSMVGVHIPELTPQYRSSYENSFGPRSWGTRYTNPGLTRFGYPLISENDNISPWDYFDNTWWLARNKTAKFPWITFSNGRNDNDIGWDQAWRNVNALKTYKVPFNFTWGQYGHSQRPSRLGGDDRYSNVIIRNTSIPFIFLNSSIDIGNSSANAPLEGQMNVAAYWNTNSVIDSPLVWRVELGLNGNSAVDSTIASVSPKRLSNFLVDTNHIYTYSYTLNSVVVDSGNVEPDSLNNLTINNLMVNRGMYKRLTINATVKNLPPDDTLPPIDTLPPTVARDTLHVSPMICGTYSGFEFLKFPQYNPSVPVDVWPDSTENSVTVFVDSKGIGVYGNIWKYELDVNDLDSALAESKKILVPLRKVDLDNLGFVPCE